MGYKGKTTPADLQRQIKNAKVEMFKALHEAHIQRKENERLQTKHGELNVFLQQRTVDSWGGHVIDAAIAHIQKLELENLKLREALEWYSNDELYADEDLGVIARQALRGEPN